MYIHFPIVRLGFYANNYSMYLHGSFRNLHVFRFCINSKIRYHEGWRNVNIMLFIRMYFYMPIQHAISMNWHEQTRDFIIK